MTPPLDLTGQVALVTGCAKSEGLGAACARLFAARGARVVISDVAPAGLTNLNEVDIASDSPPWLGLASLEAELTAQGADVVGVTGDVSTWDDARSMVEQAVRAFGRLDILVSNAAAPQGLDRNDIADVPVEEFDRIMGVNVGGAFMMCRAALPEMRRNDYGRIVIVSSTRGKTGRRHHALYSASKAALIGMTRSLALDADHSITVNAVCPGQMLTSRLMSRLPGRGGAAFDLQAELRERSARIPVGFVGLASDVAEVVGFLASREARYVNAQTVTVDGGENGF